MLQLTAAKAKGVQVLSLTGAEVKPVASPIPEVCHLHVKFVHSTLLIPVDSLQLVSTQIEATAFLANVDLMLYVYYQKFAHERSLCAIEPRFPPDWFNILAPCAK